MTSPTPSRGRRRWPIIAAIVGGVLVAAVVAGAFALDSILLREARKQAAELSRTLGRPVAVGGVATKLLGGLGVRVTDLQVGAGPGEEVPLAALARAEVKADLLAALRSRGKVLHVREAVLEGLRVNVVRLADGTTNVQRLSDALAKQQRKEPAPAEPQGKQEKAPADLSGLRVDRAAVENARIAFLDRATPGAKELAVSDLDVEVKDLAVGKPLELALKAAVLAEKQNLELRIAAAPLPPSLTPTPVRVRLRVEPVDLAPLAPFSPPSAGFKGGRLEADLDAALGAAVPGGSGPTQVKGGFRATALRFEGQEGGKPLDVVLESDLDADAGAGNLRIGTLKLDAGPARLVGHGKVTGFTGTSPRVEGLEVTVTGLDPELLAAYYPPLRKQVGGRVAGPIGLSLRGGGGAEAQSLELRADLAPVRLALPGTATKAAGAPLSLLVRARAGGASAPVAFDASLDAAGVDLRPGGSLAKKPGDPLAVRAAGTYRQEGAAKHVEVSRLEVDVLRDRLTGKARATLAGTPKAPSTKFDAEAEAAALDLDELLLPAPKESKEAQKAAAAKPPPDPAAFAGLEGEARVKIGRLRMKKVDARNVLARIKVKEDEVSVEEGRLEVLGGSVSAAGTKLRLAHKDAPYRLVADLKGIAAEQGLSMLWDRKVVSGTVDGKIDLQGTSLEGAKVASAVSGALAGALHGGAFLGADLTGSVLKPIAAKIPFAKKITESGTTSLGKDLGFAFEVANGFAKLSKPLQASRPEGALSLTGGVRTDGTLDMPATLQLAPDVIAKLTGGKARPSAPIPVTFRLTGPAWKPSVGDLGIDAAVQAILKEAAAGAIAAPAAKVQTEAKARAEDAAKRAQEEAKKGLEKLFGR